MYDNIKNVEFTIGYTFNNKEIIEEALSHKSFKCNYNYERLEFLGDSLLNIIISEWLYEKYPNDNEGALTKKRSDLVNKKSLANIGDELSLINNILLGNSINKENDAKAVTNIISDVVESIIAAIYIDGGIENTRKFIKNHIIRSKRNNANANINYKGMLIEKCHVLGYQAPNFKLINNTEKNKQKLFKVCININDIIYDGLGNTKKNAEVNAAKKALKELS